MKAKEKPFARTRRTIRKAKRLAGKAKRAISKRKSRSIVRAAFHETKHNPPKVLESTRKKFGAERARQQQIAISLSKARRAGARV